MREPNESDVPGVCPAFSELNDRSIPATTTFGDRGESGVRAPRADRGVSLLTLLAPDAINVMFSMFSVAFAAATSKVGVHDVCDCEFGTMPVLVQSMDLSAGVIMPTSSPFVYTRVFCAVVGGEGHRGSASRGKGDGRGGDPETHSPRHIRLAGVRCGTRRGRSADAPRGCRTTSGRSRDRRCRACAGFAARTSCPHSARSPSGAWKGGGARGDLGGPSKIFVAPKPRENGRRKTVSSNKRRRHSTLLLAKSPALTTLRLR